MINEDGHEYPWLKNYPKQIDWGADIEVAPLYELLLTSALQYPNNICLDFMGRKYSYAQIAQQAQSFASGLQQIGAQHGDHIGLFLPNCPQFIVAYFGILMAGCVVVNYNPLYSKAELEHQVNDSNTQIMVTLNMKRLYEKLAPLLETTELKRIVVANLAQALPKHKGLLYQIIKRKELSRIPNDDVHHHFSALIAAPKPLSLNPIPSINPKTSIAVLQYTGGTTGVPKGVMLSHANLYANAMMCRKWFFAAKDGEETIMGVLPFFHVFAMTTIMNYGIASGFKIILHPRFEIKAVLGDITRKRPSIMAGVPTMFAAMLNHPQLSRYDLSSLKACISGGAGLPLEVKKNFETQTGCVLVEGYGLSESSPVVACNPLTGENKAGSIGLPFPQTIFIIMDKDDGVTQLTIGEIGEICVQGVQVMLGYYKRPMETAEIMQGGWLHTGDLGYIDADGYIFVVDRKKEMIISGGYNIYPRQIEEAIYAHEKVLECAVIGVAHEVKGELPKAFIVLRAGAELSVVELRAYLKERISAYAVPYDYVFVDSLPKSIIGKILKKELHNISNKLS